VILWELLTGRPLWSPLLAAAGKKVPAELVRHLRASIEREVARPSTLHRRVPTALDGPVCKALAVRPTDRYQSAQEFLTGLDDAGVALAGRGDVAGFLAQLFGAELAEERKRVRDLVEQGYVLLGGTPRSSRSDTPGSGPVPRARPEFPLDELDERPSPRPSAQAATRAASRAPSAEPSRPRSVREQERAEPNRRTGTTAPGRIGAPEPPKSRRGFWMAIGAGGLVGVAAVTTILLRGRGPSEAREPSARPAVTGSVQPQPVSTPTPPPAPVTAPPSAPSVAETRTQLEPSAAEDAAPAPSLRGTERRSRGDKERGAAFLRQAQDAYDRSSFSVAITKAAMAARAGAGAEAHVIVGDACLALKNFKGAADAYRKALKADRHSESARLGLRKALAGLDEGR
jgi:hypothetical protein